MENDPTRKIKVKIDKGCRLEQVGELILNNYNEFDGIYEFKPIFVPVAEDKVYKIISMRLEKKGS